MIAQSFLPLEDILKIDTCHTAYTSHNYNYVLQTSIMAFIVSVMENNACCMIILNINVILSMAETPPNQLG